MRVNAIQAAYLLHLNERSVRSALTSGRLPATKDGRDWQINSDDLEAVNGWHVDRARLRELHEAEERTQDSLRERISALEADMAALKARMRVLEAANTADASRTRYDGNLTVYDSPRVVAPILPAKTADATLTSTSSASFFPHHAAAAEWLIPHGVRSTNTPKSWYGWRGTPLTREAVLALAIERCDVTNHRIQWRLHRCGDPACVCVEMLG